MCIDVHFHFTVKDRLLRTCIFVQAVDLTVDWYDRRASKDGLPMLWIAKRSNYNLLCYHDDKE